MRIHPSSPEVTTPLRARAVTIGQEIFFHPGHYRPDTPAGDSLIAHELAHTLQTRKSGDVTGSFASKISRPGDAIERNADALASGATAQALAAPAGMALRTPLDGENTADHDRRQRLIRAINNAETNLIQLLQTGGLIRMDEVAAERGGVRGVIVPASTSGRSDENFVSYTAREAMIRRIINTLSEMATFYRTNPIPAGLPDVVLDPKEDPAAPDTYSTAIDTPYGHSSYGGANRDWSQLEAAYELYITGQGMSGMDYWVDETYLIPDYQIVPGAARGARRLSSGIQSGAYMVVPDIDNQPLYYWRLDGYTAVPRGATIVEFWHDDIGYYYMHRDQRIDVPNPWYSGRSSTR